MRLVPYVLLLLVSSPLAAAEPQWIWSTKNAAAKAEKGSAYFRKAFNLDEPESGTAEVAADSAFELFLNGRAIGTGDDATKRYKFNLTPRLLPGRNVLAIAAVNDGPGPAGVVAKFMVKAKGKDVVTIVTDNTWKFNLRPQGTWTRIESDDSTWPAAFALGEYGKTGSWGKAGELVEGNTGVVILNKPRSREKGLFEFRDGDRVVFLGSGFIERLQSTGYLETMLTAAMPTRNITFRNLGWSGDTVWGDARALFGSRADGFQRLLSDVALCEPTVLIVCYGENEAYAGEAGLKEFRTGLNTLLDSLEATGARIVLLGPRQHEKMPPPRPDAAKYNAGLRKYNDVIGQVAKVREHRFLDLFDYGTGRKFSTATEDGIQLTASEQGRLAAFLTCQLVDDSWFQSSLIEIDLTRRILEARNSFVSEMTPVADGVSFVRQERGLLNATDYYLADATPGMPGLPASMGIPLPVGVTAVRLSAGMPGMPAIEPNALVTVKGLPLGRYQMSVDGKLAAIFSSAELGTGVEIIDGKAISQLRELRRLINEKNTLFFHRYRPQNETYLFLFRKHEQGNNAVEIPQFDPLIAELEKKIAELKKPVKQKYELIKVK